MTEEPNKQATPGWYPDPTMANTQRYWDGEKWTGSVAPMDSQPTTPPTSTQQSHLVVIGVVAASVIGLVMALQSASLLTGTGTQWTGFAIACVAGIATFIMRKSTPRWLRVVSVAAALVALVNVVYLEVQLEDRRQEIGQLFDE